MIPVQAAPLWAYGIGATFAVAAGRQLQWWERSVRGEAPPFWARRTRSRAANPYLALTVLYAALLLAPTGMYLLWQNPAWATMHVARDHGGVWAGFALFHTGSVVVGALLGFLAARLFVLVGAGYWGYLQAVAGYFLLFFTLVHGWDGSGYRRLLSADPRAYAGWSADSVVNHCLDFATSGTFLALLVFGTAVIGTMLLAEIGWLVEGWRLPGAAADLKVPRALAVVIAGAGVYALPLGGALGASALVRLLGWWPGLAVFAGAAGLVLLPARSPVRRLYGLVGIPDRHWRVEPEEAAAAASGTRASRPG
ncbi:hypothetical protein ACFWBN_32780 [Streptomyces sp. NPDC059989]|uniref:hypothetical protein n=1 Tax=Streptomyces sp. NPDC059989 TaxID=3347026 RepID=UPI0036BEC0CE